MKAKLVALLAKYGKKAVKVLIGAAVKEIMEEVIKREKNG